jgi:hypothetical protein
LTFFRRQQTSGDLTGGRGVAPFLEVNSRNAANRLPPAEPLGSIFLLLLSFGLTVTMGVI